MSTRSFIITKHTDGRYMGQYCHSDGYPSHVGAMLRDHYSTQEKAEHLSSLGDLSSLQKHADPIPEAPNRKQWGNRPAIVYAADHNFENPQEGVAVAYGRDRAETGVEAKDVTLGTIPDMGQEYEYLWDGAAWKYRKADSSERYTLEKREWSELTPEAIAED